MTERVNIKIFTPKFRMSFPKLVVPEPFMEKGKAKGEPVYTLQALFEPDVLDQFQIYNQDNDSFESISVQDAVAQAVTQRFPGINMREEAAANILMWPIESGDAHADAQVAKGKKEESVAHYRGLKIIKMKTGAEFAPGLYDGDNKQLSRGNPADMTRAKELFYGGAYAVAEVNISPNEFGGRKYATFYINAVVFSGDGERLGGGGSMMGRYLGVKGGESDHNPMPDNEIPF